MIYPNKHIRFQDSIIYKMIHILEHQDQGEISIHELYSETQDHFQNIDEFILSLDVLYTLDMIDANFEKETINYVTRASL